MILETKTRAIIVAVALVVVMAVPILAISPIMSPAPHRELVYEYSTLNAQVYPEYYRAHIIIDAPADLYVEFTISNVQDSEYYQCLETEFYECDLATFDSHFSTNVSDPIYQEFRREYIRFGGWFGLKHFDGVYFEDVLEESVTFVWWIRAENKMNSWPLSLKLYVQYK